MCRVGYRQCPARYVLCCEILSDLIEQDLRNPLALNDLVHDVATTAICPLMDVPFLEPMSSRMVLLAAWQRCGGYIADIRCGLLSA